MPILNKFLMGVYDKDITSDLDKKEFQGVATSLKNFIGLPRGGMRRRAQSKFVMNLNEGDQFIMPFIYDDLKHYLIRFYHKFTDNTDRYQMLQYQSGTLTPVSVGQDTQVAYPKFTSNTQDGFNISMPGGRNEATIFNAFNLPNTPVGVGDGVDIVIKYPSPVILESCSFIHQHIRITTTTTAGSHGGTTTKSTTHIHYLQIFGSNDGNTWHNLVVSSTGGQIASGAYARYANFTPDIAYQYYKFVIDPYEQNTFDYRTGIYGSWGTNYQATISSIRMNTLSQAAESDPMNLTVPQIAKAHYANENKRLVVVSQEFTPRQFTSAGLVSLTTTGIDLTNFGNPSFARFYQSRLLLGGYSLNKRQWNISKVNTDDNTNSWDFALDTSPVATSAMAGKIRECESRLSESITGRQVIYFQSMTGLGNLRSGADDIPLTPTMISANIANRTPLSDIPAVEINGVSYVVGADLTTLYAFDFDYQNSRINLTPINSHCKTYFAAGIKQIARFTGQMPYIAILLQDGTLLGAIVYRTEDGFAFHCFPQELGGNAKIECIASLQNPDTAYDSLFMIVNRESELANMRTIEFIESTRDIFLTGKEFEYIKNHIALDCQQSVVAEILSDITFNYAGEKTTKKYKFTLTNGNRPEIIDGKMKLYFGTQEVLLKDILYDDEGAMWAVCDQEPQQGDSTGYQIPSRSFTAFQDYLGFDMQCFTETGFVEYDKQLGILKEPVYQAIIGLKFMSRGEYQNLGDLTSAAFTNEITNIQVSLTFGTGLKVGTEAGLEPIGYYDLPFNEWQNHAVSDLSMKLVTLADTASKNKTIIIETDYPFPAQLSFILYTMHNTGGQ